MAFATDCHACCCLRGRRGVKLLLLDLWRHSVEYEGRCSQRENVYRTETNDRWGERWGEQCGGLRSAWRRNQRNIPSRQLGSRQPSLLWTQPVQNEESESRCSVRWRELRKTWGNPCLCIIMLNKCGWNSVIYKGGGGRRRRWCLVWSVFCYRKSDIVFFSFFRLCCDILKGVTSQRNMPRRKGQGISPTKSKYVLDCSSEIFQHDNQPVCSICHL